MGSAGCTASPSISSTLDADIKLDTLLAPQDAGFVAVDTLVDLPVVDALYDSNTDASPDACDANAACDSVLCESPLRSQACPPAYACYIDIGSTDKFTCRPVRVPNRLDELCRAQDECDTGLGCLGSANTFRCRKYCNNNDDCPGQGTLCASPEGRPNVKICTEACDPLTSSLCSPDLGCSFNLFDGVTYRSCQRTGDGLPGDSCSMNHNCGRGQICATVEGEGKCRRLCNVSTQAGCSAAEQCLSFATPANFDGIEYGYCL